MSKPFPGKDLPTIFANRFSVFAGPQNTRIVFGEQHHPDHSERWLASIVVPTRDIEEFCNKVPDILEAMKRQYAEQEALQINASLRN